VLKRSAVGVAIFDYGYAIDTLKSVYQGQVGVFHCYMGKSDGSMFGNEPVWALKRFADAGFSHVLNGHDHNTYDLEKVGDTWIHRPGAIFRMKRDEVDMNRRVAVTLFGGDLLPSYYMLDSEPAAKVFDMKAKILTDNRNDSIETFVQSLGNINVAKSGSVDDELKALNLEKPVLSIITDALDQAKGGME